MPKTRIEAFTDAVIAIVMTLLVLELHQPDGDTFRAFFTEWHQFVIYLVSFVALAIYWNNHHHMFHLIKKINGNVLWANNFLILMMTLFPFAASWVGDHPASLAPQMFFGLVILGTDFAYFILGKTLIRCNGEDTPIGEMFKGFTKMNMTLILNVVALILGFFITPYLVVIVNIIMLIMWVIPDRKAEKHL
jgi:uncharacterized membrane protein